MSRHDYAASVELFAAGANFEALIMAALRCADSSNAATLRAAFPALAAEAQARYDAPGGILASDPGAVDELARRADWDAFHPGSYREDYAAELAERRERARGWARARLGLRHEPGAPERIDHPGGKDGWFRVQCLHRECEYAATEAVAERATRRVREHGRDKRAAETAAAEVAT